MKTLLEILSFIKIQSDKSSFFLDFDLSFCIFMFLLNPSISTLKDFSLAINDVKSIGNPKVSYNLKASSPFMSWSLELDSIRSLIKLKPWFSVFKKPFSSSFIIDLIKSFWLTIFGYKIENWSSILSTNLYINGSCIPRFV